MISFTRDYKKVTSWISANEKFLFELEVTISKKVMNVKSHWAKIGHKNLHVLDHRWIWKQKNTRVNNGHEKIELFEIIMKYKVQLIR